MRVFVTGATGYVGQAVATAFRRSGHQVWGLARTDEKARALAREEIRPVRGSLEEPGTFLGTAEACSVLVHAASVAGTDPFAADRRAIEALVSTAGRGARPKTLLYTSGVWIYGDTAGRPVDETSPVDPARAVAGRPESEKRVLGAPGVRALVLRPGCVYGRQGSLTSIWFRDAAQRALRIVGDGSARWAMVHRDDLGDAYVRAAESGLSGEIFNVTDRSHASVLGMAQAVARVTGYAGAIESVPVARAAETLGDFARCLALDQHVDSRKAERLLGWQPRHAGFVDEVEECFESWKAWSGTD